MHKKKKVVVVGGGVIGLCCAYELLQEGHDVTLLDKGSIGQEASLGNAGNIAPSYFMPLPSAGILKKGIQWLFVPESPLGIRFRFEPKFYVWLLKFATYCTKKHTNNVKKTLADLSMNSYKMYQVFDKEKLFNFEFNAKGRLIICNTPEGFMAEKATALMGKELGLASSILTPQEVHALNPEISLNIVGAIYYKENAHIIPKTFMDSMKKHLLENGVKISEFCEVTKFKGIQGRITHLETRKNGHISGDEFVLASGAWSQKLGEDLGIDLNIQAAKGYSVLVDNKDYKLEVPITLSEGKAIVSPFGKETLFGGTLELSGLDKSINFKKVTGILKTIKTYIPSFKEEDIKRDKIWVGFRPCSVDGLPIIGKSNKGFTNVTFATGHGMMGLTLAPITGKLVSEIISDKPLSYSLAQITPNRFGVSQNFMTN